MMGPNGSGKSTLAHVLMGHPGYEVTEGEVTFKGEDMLELEPDERARAGLFLGVPVPARRPRRLDRELPAQAVNAHRKGGPDGEDNPISHPEFRSSCARRWSC